MRAWDAERCDQHGDTAEQEHGAAEGKEPAQQDDPVLMHDQDKHPDRKQDCARDLAHVEGPRNVRHVVQEDIRKRRISFHIRHTFVHHHHNERCYPGNQERVDWKGESGRDQISLQSIALFDSV